ncbi:hypothetical protein FQN60_010083 [Etheostoma spectabile]|uniref:Uncharacterized protein n=1 Tax=Etheostoma spectabile TaxID=54343 RepID=A0A5J5D1T8_9PERO|nr:hypothetical protein FQN60_010083 [Etheostoma spectabile]
MRVPGSKHPNICQDLQLLGLSTSTESCYLSMASTLALKAPTSSLMTMYCLCMLATCSGVSPPLPRTSTFTGIPALSAYLKNSIHACSIGYKAQPSSCSEDTLCVCDTGVNEPLSGASLWSPPGAELSVTSICLCSLDLRWKALGMTYLESRSTTVPCLDVRLPWVALLTADSDPVKSHPTSSDLLSDMLLGSMHAEFNATSFI